MRPLQIVDRPPMPPHVCLLCGTGADRDHFIDLGIDSELVHKDEWGATHYTDGVIYLCNLCFTAKFTDYMRQLFPYWDARAKGQSLSAKMGSKAVEIYTNEINSLRADNERLVALVDKLNKQIYDKAPPVGTTDSAEKSGTDVLSDLIGSDIEEDSDDNGLGRSLQPGTANGDVAESGDDSTGKHEDDAGADSDASEPSSEFKISDLFDIKSGLLAAADSNKPRA